jgi:eukaryotic-like serine/threonine-protein kinase
LTGYPRQYGKYVLLEPIGAGGMSEVDLAHRGVDDTSFVRFVAIKRVARANIGDDSFVRMFMDEARINAELHHGNIVGVYDFGKQVESGDGREEYFMVMEYVPGLDLRALQHAAHKLGHRLPLRFCFSVLHEVLQGLQYAHSKVDTLGRPMNLVHRDINPRNVMVSVRGEVKVIDFGVALAEDRLEKTQGRSLKGKFAYMSPEQIEGNVSLDGRTDLYAVGLMLHELVAGVGPFHGLTELQIMHRIVMGQIAPLQVPPEFPDGEFLLQLHARALSRDRDRRYPDARAFRKDLAKAAEILGGLATQEERAALVSSLAPLQVEGIATRLKGYHESSQSMSRSVSRVIPPSAADSSGNTLGGAQVTAELGGADTQELSQAVFEPPPRKHRLWPLLLLAVLLLGAVGLLGTVGLAVLLERPGTTSAPTTSLADLVGDPDPLADPDQAVVEVPPVAVPPAAEPAAQPQPSRTSGSSAQAQPASEPIRVQPTAVTSVSPEPEPAVADAGDVEADPEPGSTAAAPVPAVDPEPAAVEPDPEPPAVEPDPEPPKEDPAPAADGPKGQLLVNSSPKSLAVQIDGSAVGTTPYTGAYTLGAHRVVVIGPGGMVCEKQATVVSARPTLTSCTFDGQQGESQDDDSRRRR